MRRIKLNGAERTALRLASAMAATGLCGDTRTDLIRQAGFSYESCFMRGRPVMIAGVKSEFPAEFPARFFPYAWNFDDGTSCGAYPTGSVTNFAVQSGKLTFQTAAGMAHVNWGAAIPSQAPLSWGYPDAEGYAAPMLSGVKFRIRQSLPESRWWVVVPGIGRRKAQKSAVVTLKGGDWQELAIGRFNMAGPWPALQLGTDTPGNRVEIDWVVPIAEGQLVPMRKVLNLPADVAWAKCSISAKVEGTEVYINGRRALRTYPMSEEEQLWNYELSPEYFHPGSNTVVIETMQTCGSAMALFDAALLCEDGTYLRFDSDHTWKRPQRVLLKECGKWHDTGFDDSGWIATEVVRQVKRDGKWTETDDDGEYFYSSISAGRRLYFNPSWKGRIMAAPLDGRLQPVFSGSEAVALRVTAPYRAGTTQELFYAIFNEMGDDLVPADMLVSRGAVELRREGAFNEGAISLPPATLPPNAAYKLALVLQENGREIEKYDYEIAVCGPVNLPEIANPTNYTDGMDLKLVWELDAAAEQHPDDFISALGDATEAPAPVIQTPLGKFRTTNPDKIAKTADGCDANFISFKYRIKHPGRPHIALAEYPDDTVRFQEMRLNDGFADTGDNAITIGNDAVVIGAPTPPAHALRQHHALFFPNDPVGTITFFGIGNRNYYKPSQAARVGKMRIYEILGDVPARKITDAPGPRRWFGQHPEAGARQIASSCFTGPAASYFKTYCLLANHSPYFYRNWMVTYRNMIRRMKFAGENAYFMGQAMYGNLLFPSRYSNYSAYDYGRSPGEMRDSGVLMARMFGENNLGWFSSLQLTRLPTIEKTCTDEAVAAGADTLGVITRDGRQVEGFRGITPNWLRPECQAVYQNMVNELLELYGREPGWKGIKLYLNEANGPAWATWEDPMMSSYDDFTIALFEKQTEINIPVDRTDARRFEKRYQWLVANAQTAWIRWRADKMNEIYAWTRDRLAQTRSDLNLLLFVQLEKSIQPDPAAPAAGAVGERALEYGFDLERLKAESNMIVAVCVPGAADAITPILADRAGYPVRLAVARDTPYLADLANDAKNGIAFRLGWYEPQPRTPARWVWPKGSHQLAAEAWPYSAGASLAENWANIFIRANPSLIVNSMQDLHMWNGREYYTGRFAQAFRSIPTTVYKRIQGADMDEDLWVAAGKYDGAVYGYVANPFWWKTAAALTPAPGIDIEDLIVQRKIKPGQWTLALEPYEIRTFRAAGGAPDALFLSAAAAPETRAREYLAWQFADSRAVIQKHAAIAARTPGLAEKLANWINGCEELYRAGRYGAAYSAMTFSEHAARIGQMTWSLPGYSPLVARIPRTAQNPVIDGRFDDWKTMPPAAEINDPEKILVGDPALHGGARDVSGRVAACWDGDCLYLDFIVQDDDLQPGVRGADSVEIYLDMDLYGDYGEGVYSEDDFNIKLAPVVHSAEVILETARGLRGVKMTMPDNIGVKSAWMKTPGGYRIEAAVPWRAVWPGGTPAPGMEFGFDAMIIDSDRNKTPPPLRVMFWSSPKLPFNDPRTLGRAILE